LDKSWLFVEKTSFDLSKMTLNVEQKDTIFCSPIIYDYHSNSTDSAKLTNSSD